MPEECIGGPAPGCVVNILCSARMAQCELIPVPKKGDLSRCDNFRGIALLDVVGKLCGRIIQNQLWPIVEAEVPESQCGFRVGRGCPDAIFCVRQLIEKAYEHHSSIFLVFIDLYKAYDSVPDLPCGLLLLGLAFILHLLT